MQDSANEPRRMFLGGAALVHSSVSSLCASQHLDFPGAVKTQDHLLNNNVTKCSERPSHTVQCVMSCRVVLGGMSPRVYSVPLHHWRRPRVAQDDFKAQARYAE